MALRSRYQPGGVECGLDEAGRGCLAGPVFAAAVILDDRHIPPELNDSKKLTSARREELRLQIESQALDWAVAYIEPEVIDKINILQASIQAMHLAITQLETKPGLLLIDGNRFNPFPNMKHICVIRGDATYASIAAASILAKTHRDEYMLKIHEAWPAYGWASNKGYPTPAHIEALRSLGPCPLHRRSFVLKGQLRLPI